MWVFRSSSHLLVLKCYLSLFNLECFYHWELCKNFGKTFSISWDAYLWSPRLCKRKTKSCLLSDCSHEVPVLKCCLKNKCAKSFSHIFRGAWFLLSVWGLSGKDWVNTLLPSRQDYIWHWRCPHVDETFSQSPSWVAHCHRAMCSQGKWVRGSTAIRVSSHRERLLGCKLFAVTGENDSFLVATVK